MPRGKRPLKVRGSEYWSRVAVNDQAHELNRRIADLFGWDPGEQITWLSPRERDNYAEYYDQAFLDKLGVKHPKVPLASFWPASGPRWDGLAKTPSGKLIVVEAKAHIDEAVDFGSGATALCRTAKTSRTTTPKGPAELAVDTMGREG